MPEACRTGTGDHMATASKCKQLTHARVHGSGALASERVVTHYAARSGFGRRGGDWQGLLGTQLA